MKFYIKSYYNFVDLRDKKCIVLNKRYLKCSGI